MTVFAVEYAYDAESTDARDTHRPAHRQWLAGLAEENVLLSSGPYTDGSGALLIFKAPDQLALDHILQQDPFVAVRGIAGTRITPWNPVMGLLAGHSA